MKTSQKERTGTRESQQRARSWILASLAVTLAIATAEAQENLVEKLSQAWSEGTLVYDAEDQEASITYDPRESSGILMTLLDDSSHPSHGSLLWPNGLIFLHRNQWQPQYDGVLRFVHGHLFLYRSPTFPWDGQLLWPTPLGSQIPVLYAASKLIPLGTGVAPDHGTCYRPDGSLWLSRYRGGEGDGEREGGRAHLVRGVASEDKGGYRYKFMAKIESDLELHIRYTVYGPQWRIVVEYRTAENRRDETLTITECFQDIVLE